MDRDMVCGMTVKKEGSIEAVYNGRQIHFCSNECKDKYFAAPADYEINYDIVSNEVKPEKEMKYTTTFEGRPLFFMSEENKATFEKNPGAYVYAECPVSGKVFLRQDAGATTEYKGRTYYFCCKDCLKKFNKSPKKYLNAASVKHGVKVRVAENSTGTKAELGCPMKKAGGCPKAKTCKK
jgi:YHS domain-containing protein